jgi:hypothetical protein
LAYRFRSSGGGFPAWAIVAPIVVLGVLLVIYMVGWSAERPSHMSIRSEPGAAPPAGAPKASSPSLNPGVMLVIVAGIAAVIVGVVLASRSKSSSSPAVTRRAAPVRTMTPAPARPRTPSPGPPEETIDCPNCAERIKKKAMVCRFCGFKLSDFVERKHPLDNPDETEIGPM